MEVIFFLALAHVCIHYLYPFSFCCARHGFLFCFDTISFLSCVSYTFARNKEELISMGQLNTRCSYLVKAMLSSEPVLEFVKDYEILDNMY